MRTPNRQKTAINVYLNGATSSCKRPAIRSGAHHRHRVCRRTLNTHVQLPPVTIEPLAIQTIAIRLSFTRSSSRWLPSEPSAKRSPPTITTNDHHPLPTITVNDCHASSIEHTQSSANFGIPSPERVSCSDRAEHLKCFGNSKNLCF